MHSEFGIPYQESMMTLEENGSLSMVLASVLLPSDRQCRRVSATLRSRKQKCEGGRQDKRSCSGFSRGELVLAFEPGLIYPRTVSDMSAGAGSKMRKGQYSRQERQGHGRRGWGSGGWWGRGRAERGKNPEQSSNIPPSSENPVVSEPPASTSSGGG